MRQSNISQERVFHNESICVAAVAHASCSLRRSINPARATPGKRSKLEADDTI